MSQHIRLFRFLIFLWVSLSYADGLGFANDVPLLPRKYSYLQLCLSSGVSRNIKSLVLCKKRLYESSEPVRTRLVEVKTSWWIMTVGSLHKICTNSS